VGIKVKTKTETNPEPEAGTVSTDAQARAAPAGRYRVIAPGVVGLALRKTSDKTGSYIVRYWSHGKRRDMGIGSLASTKLVAACKRAREIAGERSRGDDPIEARRVKRAAEKAKQQPVTFIKATETYLKTHEHLWRHADARRTWLSPIQRYAIPLFGKLDVNDIRADHIADAMRAAVKGKPAVKKGDVAAKGGSEVAKRLRSKVWAVFNGCLARRERDQARGNPADAKLMGQIAPQPGGDRPNFRRIEKIDDAPTAFQRLWGEAEAAGRAELDAWLIMALCALRPGEALNMRWSWISLQHRLLTIPPPDTKSNRKHVVPLSSAAITVLERRAQAGSRDMVFASKSGRPPPYSNFARAPRRLGLDLGTPHSWRSVFKDWSRQAGVAYDLSEEALAHLVGSKTERSYARDPVPELRRPVMESFARWLTGAGAEVVDLSQRRALSSRA
jgi:integrase